MIPRPSKKPKTKNVSMSHTELSPIEPSDDEKKIKVQQQVLHHMKTGFLPDDPEVTPVQGQDGQVRQYLLNRTIDNPEENEPMAPLVLSDTIKHTTVDRSKVSSKRNGIVRAYAANTNKGIIRNYNEDRVSIILNILKPHSRKGEDWPKCSFFGVFDGHGGAACADYLRDNLHQFVIKEPSFPSNPEEAIIKGFESAERVFLETAKNKQGGPERSGSCAIVLLIIGDMCYVVNVGDSRAVLSYNQGKSVVPLSRDHKPSDPKEKKRLTDA